MACAGLGMKNSCAVMQGLAIVSLKYALPAFGFGLIFLLVAWSYGMVILDAMMGIAFGGAWMSQMILAPGFVISLAMFASQPFLMIARHSRRIVLSAAAAAVVNLNLAHILIIKHGAVGAAIAIAVSAVVNDLINRLFIHLLYNPADGGAPQGSIPA